MKKTVELNNLNGSKVVIENVDANIKIEDNRIAINAIVEKIEEKIVEQKNKLGIICQKKETTTKKIPVEVKSYVDVAPKYIKLLDKETVINLICENISYEYGSFHKYNTTNVSLEEVQKHYPSAYDVSFKEQRFNLSNQEIQKGYYYYSVFQTEIITIKSYSLKQAIIKEVKSRLEKELNSLKIELYNESLFFPSTQNLKKFMPVKLIGSFNSNRVKYLYDLESFCWDFEKNKLKSQYYYVTNQFDLIAFTNTEKELCEIDENDIITPEEYLKKRGIDVNNLPVSIDIKQLALKEYYNEAEEIFKREYGEDIKPLQRLFS